MLRAPARRASGGVTKTVSSAVAIAVKSTPATRRSLSAARDAESLRI